MKYDEAQEGEGRRSRKQIQLQPGMAKQFPLPESQQISLTHCGLMKWDRTECFLLHNNHMTNLFWNHSDGSTDSHLQTDWISKGTKKKMC